MIIFIKINNDLQNLKNKKMKKIFVLFVMFVALQSNAQICLRTNTSIEGSTLKQFSFNEIVYCRKKFNVENKPKTVYNFFSIYKLDSIVGAKVCGIDMDLMSEKFDTRKANSFRHWNKIRIGFSVIMERNIYFPPLPLEKTYGYLNGEGYLNYLHIPQKSRGDRATKSHRGSIMLSISATPTRRILGYVKYKPFGNVWIGASFKQRFPIPKLGLFTEIELNKRGYDKTKTESSKDLYRGFTIFGGPDYDIKNKNYSFSLGIKYEGRNH